MRKASAFIKKRSVCLFTMISMAASLGLATGISFAGAATTVSARVVMSGPSPAMIPAGDDEGHLVGLGQRIGEAVFDDGRKAAYSNVFFLDLRRGEGADMWGYTKMVFEDNSWLFFKWDSLVVGRDKNGPIGKGKGIILRGTGRYKGIQGEVSFTNRRLTEPPGATEARADFTYTLP